MTLCARGYNADIPLSNKDLFSVQTEAECIMETTQVFLDVKMHQYSKLGHRKENIASVQQHCILNAVIKGLY